METFGIGSSAIESDQKGALLLQIEDVAISVTSTSYGQLRVVEHASLSIPVGGAVGLVGESGSGKTMLCRAIIGTLGRHGAAVTGGSILFNGTELAGASEKVFRRLRGSEIGYVSQSSLAALNPVLTVETHLMEVLMIGGRSRRDARAEALEVLDTVKIPRAGHVLKNRPHELSGGMRQRVIIACAIARRPRLLVADEPTTALDVTVQREVLKLINSIRSEMGMAILMVSHDLGVIENVCDSMTVMYSGATVESGPVGELAASPQHPYTKALRDSRVDIAEAGSQLPTLSEETMAVGHWPDGCRFAPRCPRADSVCRVGEPPVFSAIGDSRRVACHHTLGWR